MCGIAGFYRARMDENKIRAVIASLAHRGPDGEGVYTHDDVGLIHTRLSIIELSQLGLSLTGLRTSY